MLKPRDSDLPALFLVLVVLPVVAYILLGKWSESSKRKQKVGLLAQLADEESFRSEPVAAPSEIPIVSPPKAALHECAECHAPATTRCSRCKFVRYCSGKCQIIHWRHTHKYECQPLENNSSSSKLAYAGELAQDQSLSHENMSKQFIDGHPKKPLQGSTYSSGNDSADVNASIAWSSNMKDPSKILKGGRKSTDKRASRKFCGELIARDGRSSSASPDGISRSKTHLKPSKEAVLKNKLKAGDSVYSNDDFSTMYEVYTNMVSSRQVVSREQPCIGLEAELERDYGCQEDASCASKCGTNVFEHATDDTVGNYKFYKNEVIINAKVAEGSPLPEAILNSGNFRQKSALHSNARKVSKSSKSLARSSLEQSENGKEKTGYICDEPAARGGNITPSQGGNGTTSFGFMKMMGLKKSLKVSKKDASATCADVQKKMLFPYEEFMKLFQYEIFDLTPRGLSNCGNSCYANAVLQCLTCTKPLVVYLLKRTHSRSCHAKRWCLMCELEQHVATMRDGAGAMSPSRILSQMRSMNCPMGDGSQEDAHEFLRLLVASMQSICLEEMGGEKHVHPSIQETTFIQHTFGGRLRSKVECLKCRHQSERCENIMDLTLEIYGWVESLEDALTQFTAWEDLDGENMYKCGRCTSYVRARKQLSIDEAPNILTIVLKRFQEGNYGKINKCITFPEMLDMIPFMTGTYDIPPLYTLYAVVVHMDTLNASFSGHYVSYVKDLRGNWLRIDDSEVQLVPMSQVMSEGAYILFYMRSYPRPSHAARNHSQAQASAKHRMSKPSRSKSGQEPSDGIGSSMVYDSHTSNDMLRFTPMKTETYAEFSDATSSSDWSLFTSSEEASFTTESTRDSFSTSTDYADMPNPAHYHDFEAYDGNFEPSFNRIPGSCYRL